MNLGSTVFQSARSTLTYLIVKIRKIYMSSELQGLKPNSQVQREKQIPV